jgi:hypothetical protein
MEPPPTSVTIRCSPLYALVILFVTVPLLALVLASLVAGTPWSDQGLSTRELVICYLLLPLPIVFLCVTIGSWIRHWETLFTTFEVSSTGIIVESSPYGRLLLGWNDLTRATYSHTQSLIILESPKLTKPLAIRKLAQGVAPEFTAARKLIRGAMGGRWSQRLL